MANEHILPFKKIKKNSKNPKIKNMQMAYGGNKRMENKKEDGAISFFIPMKKIPTTAQQKDIVVRGGKPKVIDSDRLREARSLLMGELWQRSPEVPMGGVLELRTVWCFPMPKSGTVEVPVTDEDGNMTKKKVRLMDGMSKPTRPDTDNLVKLLKDIMTKTGYWWDDSQVAFETIGKVYSDVVGVLVDVRQTNCMMNAMLGIPGRHDEDDE